MTRLDCKSELVARERAGELSSAERAALGAHLAICESCRFSQRLGRDFEAEARLEAGDGERIAALSKVARSWATDARERVSAVHERPVRRRAPVWVFAAAFAFVALGASAGIRALSQESGAPRVLPAPHLEPAAPRREAAPVARVEPAQAVAVLPAEPASARPATTEETPRALFQRANEARRVGDGSRAVSLYRKLIARFPSSPEAALSQVRLGGMLLERGDARAALAHFDRYLAERGGGTLSPEAHYGRGRALASLGRAREEASTWARLLADFPKSPYAGHARRRLEALGDVR